jgi:hypothetical protein
LPDDSAITVVVRVIRSAAGVFGVGHLGELTQYVPFGLADAVLEETRRCQRRLRDLPSRVGVYFVLALGLSSEAGYLGVWGKLTAGLDPGASRPSEKALRDLRRRVGAAPLRALFEVVAGPLAQPVHARGPLPGPADRRVRRLQLAPGAGPRAEPGWLGKVRSRTA